MTKTVSTNRFRKGWPILGFLGLFILAGGCFVLFLDPFQWRAKNAETATRSEPASESPRAYAVGDSFHDTLSSAGHGPEMIVVPAGQFTMGSPAEEPAREDDEGPQRIVTISKPFAVGKFEVTVEQYKMFADASGRAVVGNCIAYFDGASYWAEEIPEANWTNTGFPQTGRHPVACVSWNDAKAYSVWLSEETGMRYRLLSEAEFEYVNRAGEQASYLWGTDPNAGCDFANGGDVTAKKRYSELGTSECDDGHIHTAPVGSYRANDFKLYDTAGNVWEWVEDCWNETYAGAPSDGSAWLSGNCDRRTSRGGSWGNHPVHLRSAYRSRLDTSQRYDVIGFRVARTLDD